MCMYLGYGIRQKQILDQQKSHSPDKRCDIFRIQVNIPAESGEMGVLANHVPSIEQLKPGLVEVIEESSGASKQFFC